MYGLNHERRFTGNVESGCNEGITTFVSGLGLVNPSLGLSLRLLLHNLSD